MSSVFRLLAGISVVLGLALAPAGSQAQTPVPAPFTPEKAAPARETPKAAAPAAAPKVPAKETPKAAAPAPSKAAEKNVLQAPTAKPAAAKPPSPPASAPRTPVETKNVPAFVPPGPPPMDEANLHRPVLAVLKAAQVMNSEEDAARWVDAGACWVWIGLKRDQAWSKYRFAYDGGCKQGRADGPGRLKIDAQNGDGKWAPLQEIDTTFLSGVPLGESKESSGAKLIVGLADRTVLSWMGSSLNEEAEVFTVGRADDQGRAIPCSAQGIMAVAQSDDIGGARFKHLLRRAASVVSSQCPDKVRTLWLTSLAPAEGLTLVSRQGFASADPIRAQAEIREGMIFSYSQRFSSPPDLIPQVSAVPGAQSLMWTPPIDELDHQLLLVIALPAFLLLLLLVAMRIAYASMRHVVADQPKNAAVKPANNGKRR